MARSVVPLLLAVLAAGCGGSAASQSGAPGDAGGPPAGAEGILRHETPQGGAAIQLVVAPREIGPGGTVTIRLRNRGDVQLLTGLMFNVERWDGERWVEVPWPENTGFPDIGIILPPGGSTRPQQWPTDGIQVEAGWYRAVKSALYEDPDHVRPATELEARTRFRVRGNG